MAVLCAISRVRASRDTNAVLDRLLQSMGVRFSGSGRRCSSVTTHDFTCVCSQSYVIPRDAHSRVLVGKPRISGTLEPQIEHLARDLSKSRYVLYVGRGTSYPLALEGALKLKEISYIHAEGYAAGELKHGPIALIDETMPVIVIAPHDRVFEKTVSNMQEVAARGGRIRLLTDPKGARPPPIKSLPTFILPH